MCVPPRRNDIVFTYDSIFGSSEGYIQIYTLSLLRVTEDSGNKLIKSFGLKEILSPFNVNTQFGQNQDKNFNLVFNIISISLPKSFTPNLSKSGTKVIFVPVFTEADNSVTFISLRLFLLVILSLPLPSQVTASKDFENTEAIFAPRPFVPIDSLLSSVKLDPDIGLHNATIGIHSPV